MPLAESASFKKNENKIWSILNELIEAGLIVIKNKQNIKIGFSIDLQFVHAKEIDTMDFGKPEGIRLVLFEGKQAVSIVDFIYSGREITFLHSIKKDHLKNSLDLIKSIEKEILNNPKKYAATYLNFLINLSPFVLIKNKSSIIYFKYEKKRLIRQTKKDIKKELKSIVSSRDKQIF